MANALNGNSSKMGWIEATRQFFSTKGDKGKLKLIGAVLLKRFLPAYAGFAVANDLLPVVGTVDNGMIVLFVVTSLYGIAKVRFTHNRELKQPP